MAVFGLSSDFLDADRVLQQTTSIYLHTSRAQAYLDGQIPDIVSTDMRGKLFFAGITINLQVFGQCFRFLYQHVILFLSHIPLIAAEFSSAS
jgi:hypothetical protein